MRTESKFVIRPNLSHPTNLDEERPHEPTVRAKGGFVPHVGFWPLSDVPRAKLQRPLIAEELAAAEVPDHLP